MYTIGEFSRLCMVTTKTLRHYDKIDLLIPAHTDDETGYRYYEATQFRDMFFILRCKEYGFTLEETAELLHADSHIVAARFAAKHEEHKKELLYQRMVLQKMQEDMELLKKGIDIMSTGKVEIKLVDKKPFEIVSVRGTIAIKDFDQLYGKVFQRLEENKLQISEGIVAVYHSEEFDPEKTDIEIGAIVAKKSAATRTIPGGTYVMGIHLGSYANLSETYAAVVKWIEENGYHIAGEPYERYLNSPHEVPEEKLVTEVYFPLAK